jgi:hypothetical protein
MNLKKQLYKDVVLTQCNRKYGNSKARRFYLYTTKQAIWIPCIYLEDNGTLKENANIDWLFQKPNNKNILKIAKEMI